MTEDYDGEHDDQEPVFGKSKDQLTRLEDERRGEAAGRHRFEQDTNTEARAEAWEYNFYKGTA